MSTTTPFITLTHVEIETLAKTKSACAMATYLAIKSYTYRGKATSYPTRKSLSKRMGNAFNLRSITEAIKQLAAVGLINRIYDAVTNIWFFKVLTKSPVRRKKPTGRERQPAHQKKHQITSKNNTYSKEERTGRWIKEVLDIKSQMKFWKTSKWAKIQVLKGVTPPSLTLPKKHPEWLTTDDVKAFIEKHNDGIYEGTWLWEFWNGLEC